MTDQTVRVPRAVVEDMLRVGESFRTYGYGKNAMAPALDALCLALAAAPEAEHKQGDLHTLIMDLMHGDLMRQNPGAFAEEDGNSTIAIPVAKAFLTIDVSALAESVLASLQRPQTTAELSGNPGELDSGLVDRLVEAALVAKSMADNAAYNLNQAGLTTETASCERAFSDIYKVLDEALQARKGAA